MNDLSASDKHCIFRSGSSWFSLPAVSVREISIAPDMVPVPNCHPAIAGLCHLRSEFIPVIILNALFDIDSSDVSQPHDKLMVIHGHSAWALRIAEASALESIETLVTPEARGDDANQTAITGTCMFRHQIVRVLDPTRVFRIAQQALESFWRRPYASPRSSCRDIGSLR
ncbi:MAG: chemotaxis protein CheW [Planctomycetaceae bacterium]